MNKVWLKGVPQVIKSIGSHLGTHLARFQSNPKNEEFTIYEVFEVSWIADKLTIRFSTRLGYAIIDIQRDNIVTMIVSEE